MEAIINKLLSELIRLNIQKKQKKYKSNNENTALEMTEFDY